MAQCHLPAKHFETKKNVSSFIIVQQNTYLKGTMNERLVYQKRSILFKNGIKMTCLKAH